MEMTCLAQVPGALAQIFDGIHLFAGHEGAPVPAKQQPRSEQRKELDDLRARLDTSEARTRQREGKLENVRAEVETLRPNVKMRVSPSTPPPDVLGFGRQLPSHSARIHLPRH